MTDESLYHLEEVTQTYGGRTVLQVERLDIEAQSITGLIGPNGSGKSTLMRILGFLERPASGRATFRGQPIERVPLEQRRQVTMLVQEPYLLKRSVFGNVAYGLKLRHAPETTKTVRDALSRVGLAPDKFLHRSWRELSGGEAQRVALAARLALKPKVLLLDEPTASVDRESSERILHAALDARDQWGTTLIIISHRLTWLRQITDRILLMDYGSLRRAKP